MIFEYALKKQQPLLELCDKVEKHFKVVVFSSHRFCTFLCTKNRLLVLRISFFVNSEVK